MYAFRMLSECFQKTISHNGMKILLECKRIKKEFEELEV